MSERKINLEEINLEEILQDCWITTLDNSKEVHAPTEDVKLAMIEFGKQLLELAAENADMNEDFGGGEIYNITEYKVYNDNDRSRSISVNKQSILDTIKQVE